MYRLKNTRNLDYEVDQWPNMSSKTRKPKCYGIVVAVKDFQ